MYENPARRSLRPSCGVAAMVKQTDDIGRTQPVNERFAEFGFENTYGHGLHRDLPFGIGQCAERTAEALLRQSVAQAVVSERQGPSHAEISFIGGFAHRSEHDEAVADPTGDRTAVGRRELGGPMIRTLRIVGRIR